MIESSKLWLRSLTIHRYEQFRDCPRVEFSPDDNLILGINGSGKTSLLRLLAAVLRWNYDGLLGQPFDIEFEQVHDGANEASMSIHGRVQNQPTSYGTDLPPRGRHNARPKHAGFEARFELRPSDQLATIVEIRDSAIRWKLENTEKSDWNERAWSGDEWLADELWDAGCGPVRMTERAGMTFLVRETDTDFTQLTEHLEYEILLPEFLSPGSPFISYIEFLEIESRQWFELMYELMLSAFEKKNPTNSLPPVTYQRDAGTGRGIDPSPLLRALDAESIVFRLKLEKTERLADEMRCEGKGVEIRVRFASGTEIVDSRLTFGQKRLITIALGALVCGGSPLLVDEIDNGLHPGLLEKTLELIQGRQTFIASHNKLVVDLLDYESADDIRRTIHICRRNPEDGTQSLLALTDEEAREVFDKITVGIMNPSDVLLREGLW